MDSIYELLNNIKKRPRMFLAKKSILHLRSFLIGYNLARLNMGLAKTPQEQEFNDFSDWIQVKFNDDSTRSWADIILLNSEDESQALDSFFELLEKFKDSKSK
jgi:hypothetical protein